MIKHTLIPTPYEAVLFTIISVAILGMFTLAPIVRNTNASTYYYYSDTIGTFVSGNLQKLNTPRLTTIFSFLIWAIVGALAYVLVWSIGALWNSYREDVSPFHHLIVPQGYRPDYSMPTRITRIVVRTLAVMGIIFWTSFFFATIVPESVSIFVTALSKLDSLSIVGIFLSILYMGGGLFVFAVLFRLVLLRRRVFATNE